MSRKFLDITGQRFGKLKVLSFYGKKNKISHWKCICECGKIKICSTGNLRSGLSKSCGCSLRKEFGESAFNKIYLQYQRDASRRNIIFNLSKEEFRLLTKGNCFYCGKQPSCFGYPSNDSNSGFYLYNGLDRNKTGDPYDINSCVSCCTDCNLAKQSMSRIEFIDWINRVSKYLGSSISSSKYQII